MQSLVNSKITWMLKLMADKGFLLLRQDGVKIKTNVVILTGMFQMGCALGLNKLETEAFLRMISSDNLPDRVGESQKA